MTEQGARMRTWGSPSEPGRATGQWMDVPAETRYGGALLSHAAGRRAAVRPGDPAKNSHANDALASIHPYDTCVVRSGGHTDMNDMDSKGGEPPLWEPVCLGRLDLLGHLLNLLHVWPRLSAVRQYSIATCVLGPRRNESQVPRI